MSKIKIIIIALILSAGLNAYLFWQGNTNKKELRLATSISNIKSSIYMYSLRNNNIAMLEGMLRSDLVQLINDYDEDDFNQSKILSGICKNWNKIISIEVAKYLEENKEKNKSRFYKRVYKNSQALSKRCSAEK